MQEFAKFIEGYQTFRTDVYPNLKATFDTLAHKGQAPKALVISCCDSRVEPSLILQTDPGELFVIRNVASLVPPFEQDQGYHGVSAAVEFAIQHLHIPNIIVMGHTMCGGIQALVSCCSTDNTQFIGQWMSLGDEARTQALQHTCATEAERVDLASQLVVLTSLKNLRTFPFIKEKEEKKQLTLHGWQFNIQTAQIHAYHAEKDCFLPL